MSLLAFVSTRVLDSGTSVYEAVWTDACSLGGSRCSPVQECCKHVQRGNRDCHYVSVEAREVADTVGYLDRGTSYFVTRYQGLSMADQWPEVVILALSPRALVLLVDVVLCA